MENQNQDELAKFGVVEIRVAVYKGAAATLKAAYAVGYDGMVILSSHSDQPDWSYDRAEVKRRVRYMTLARSNTQCIQSQEQITNLELLRYFTTTSWGKHYQDTALPRGL